MLTDLLFIMFQINISGLVETKISVSPFDSIQNVLSALSLSNCYVLFKGSVLTPAFSFSFYKINENDTIFIVNNKESRNTSIDSNVKSHPSPKSLSPEVVQKMHAIFDAKYGKRLKDPENVFNCLKSFFDPTSSREAARVNDLFRQRIENSPSSFRKIYARISGLNSKSFLEEQHLPTILPEKALQPSTQFLPNLA